MNDSELPAGPSPNGTETDHLPLAYWNLKTKPGFRKKVLEIMADRQWHTADEIFASLHATFPTASLDSAKNAMGGLLRCPPPGLEIVPQKIDGHRRYRLRRSAASSRHVPAAKLTDFMEGFPALLRQLEEWSNKGQYEIVPSSLQGIAVQMKRLFAALKQSIS